MNRLIDPEGLRDPFGKSQHFVSLLFSGAWWALVVLCACLMTAVLLAYDWVGNHRRQP